MKIEKFHNKYNLSYYRIAQIIAVSTQAVLAWKDGKNKEANWLGLLLDLQDYYYSQNGKFFEK